MNTNKVFENILQASYYNSVHMTACLCIVKTWLSNVYNGFQEQNVLNKYNHEKIKYEIIGTNLNVTINNCFCDTCDSEVYKMELKRITIELNEKFNDSYSMYIPFRYIETNFVETKSSFTTYYNCVITFEYDRSIYAKTYNDDKIKFEDIMREESISDMEKLSTKLLEMNINNINNLSLDIYKMEYTIFKQH